MGTDIMFYRCRRSKRNKERYIVTYEDIFEGARYYNWFDLFRCRDEDEYFYFPSKDGAPFTETNNNFNIEYLYTNGGRDYQYFKVKDFLKWYEEYKPYFKAGWVDQKATWLYRTKGISPNEEIVTRFCPVDDNGECNLVDYEFLEYKDNNDPIIEVYNYIKEHHFNPDDIIFSFFMD